MESFEVCTHERRELIEVTTEIRRLVSASRITEGLCVVYCPHTTAAVTINENADPDVVHDVLLWYGQTVPQRYPGFRHGEGNSDSHIQCTMIGPSQTLIINNGDLVLGRWQGIYFCEFDGPRKRTLHVQVMEK